MNLNSKRVCRSALAVAFAFFHAAIALAQTPARGGTACAAPCLPSQPPEPAPWSQRPAPTISGVLVDGNGRPVLNATVHAYSEATGLGGVRKQSGAASRVTDYYGRFTFSGLPPGEYFIAVVPPMFWRRVSGQLAYGVTYYPSVNRRDRAIPLTLTSTSEFNIGIQLQPTPTFHVRGTVASDPTGSISLLSSLQIQLLQRVGFVRYIQRGIPAGPDRSFDIGNVVPGIYVVATGALLEKGDPAGVEIEVVDHDIDGVILQPR